MFIMIDFEVRFEHIPSKFILLMTEQCRAKHHGAAICSFTRRKLAAFFED